MATVAVFGLLLGTLLAVFGTFVYVTNAFNDPDDETLRMARTIATTGRRAGYAALAAWMTLGHAANPPMTLLLLLAAVSATVSYTTRLGAPGTARKAIL
jgi:hypothetical protein